MRMKIRDVTRMKFLLPLAAAFLSITGGADSQAVLSDSFADSILEQLFTLPLGAPYEKWKKNHNWSSCEQFHGNGQLLYADAEYCFACAQGGAVASQWFFYAFGAEEPPMARLEQVKYSVSGLPSARLEQIYRRIVGEMSYRLNTRIDTIALLGLYGPAEFGAGAWGDWVRLQNDSVCFYVYFTGAADTFSTMCVLARDSQLVREKEHRRYEHFDDTSFEESIAAQLADTLLEIEPLLAQLIVKSNPNDSVFQKCVYDQLSRMLSHGAPDSSDEARQWLASDMLASKLVGYGTAADSQRAALKRYALTYSELWGGGWFYHRDVLWRLWQKYPESRWGQAAFTLLLNMAFNRTGGCGDVDEFANVITQGEHFVASYPSSSWISHVYFLLGLAYETWYSITESHDDGYVEDLVDKYKAGGEDARVRAIDYYQKVNPAIVSAEMKFHIQHVLPRLRLSIDTNSRAFICIMD